MIDYLEVGNVRLFGGPRIWKFDLPALTVLCGTNSAGKSTIMKLPLLLRQSQGIGEALQSASASLRLVGSQIDLGTYESFVSGNDVSNDVTLGISIIEMMSREAATTLKLWKAQGQRLPLPNTQAANAETLVPYRLSARFVFGVRRRIETKARRKELQHQRDEVLSGVDIAEQVLKSALFTLSVDGHEVADWNVALVPDPAHQPVGRARYQLQIPTALLDATGWLDLVEARSDEKSGYTSFPAAVLGILPNGITVKVRTNRTSPRGRKPETQFATWPLPFPLGNALGDFQTALSRVHYLGPLRALPKRFYVAQAAVDPGMDSAGEFLPYVLRDRGNDLVTHTPPMAAELVAEPLTIALDRWLRYFRTGDVATDGEKGEIDIKTTRDVLIEFSLRSTGGGTPHALADSGFGYSQLLPILVRGLLAPPSSSLLIEQPELHLNPALQVRLAEFFVGLARAAKQVMLETHSEHIVNAMRVLAAEARQETGNCTVFFLDAPGGKPEVRRLEVSSDGSVENWPRNFFGEAASLRARLLRAQANRPSEATKE